MPGLFRDLSARTKLRISGNDRVRFLNGQTTNDMRKASAEAAQESCVLNVKGHLEAHLFFLATSDAVFCDAAPELREILPARFERYIIADDVVLDDVTEQFALFHFLGEPPKIEDEAFRLRAVRLGEEGWDIWLEARLAERARATWRAREFEELTEEAWEVRRVEAGIPRWGRELSPEILPPEAGLAARAIDYDKGCYIGQETISRMKMSGQTRQRLCGLRADKNTKLQVGAELRAAEKVVGKITSAIFSERFDSPLALAFIKRGSNEVGTRLVTTPDTPLFVTELPFRSAPS